MIMNGQDSASQELLFGDVISCRPQVPVRLTMDDYDGQDSASQEMLFEPVLCLLPGGQNGLTLRLSGVPGFGSTGGSSLRKTVNDTVPMAGLTTHWT